MTAPEVELRAVWHRLAGRRHDHHLDCLLRRLAEPHRRYHTAVHVMWVLRHLADTPTELDLSALQLAALYHDAIYDPRAASPANEVASADLAATVAIDLGWDVDRVALVRRLVLSTAHLEPTTHADPHEQALIAADLAILEADPADYSAYAVGVRAEYAHVSDTDWRVGRSAVLEHLLTFDSLGSRARANLAAELAQHRR